MPTYAKTELRLSVEEAFVAQACALSDRIGRHPFLLAANVLFAVSAWPLFSWIQASPSQSAFAALQMVLCALLAGVLGVFSTLLAEQFPTRVRSSGLAIA